MKLAAGRRSMCLPAALLTTKGEKCRLAAMGWPANADGDEESFASAVFQDRGKLGVDGGGGEESGG